MALQPSLDVVLAYHVATKHFPHRFARSLDYMDWDTQPDPFRRYRGAPLVLLDEVPSTPIPLYDDLFRSGRVATRGVDRASISQLLYDSLALSAWKQFQDSRWSLRVNPSSGNLHPTEGYLVAGAVPGLLETPAVSHYAPSQHGLEVRRQLTAEQWQALADQLPANAILVGLTSITWRESWKYGERAFRYCQHDVGHALGAMALAAAGLGWETRLLETVNDGELAVLLGVHQQHDGDMSEHSRLEAEHADCLLALYPQGSEFVIAQQRAFHLPASLLQALAAEPLAGQPNVLSHDHHYWPIIDAVSEASQRTEPPGGDFWHQAPTAPETSAGALSARSVSARQVIRQRRSAVAMDGVTSLSRGAFYTMLAQTLPGRRPFTALPWRPAVHLALFVHRVDDLAPGLYLLLRDADQAHELRDVLDPSFAWQRPPGCPEGLDLMLLRQGDFRGLAAAVSCGQDIAGDGALAVGMLARYEEPLGQHGAWFYRRLHWEAGMIGQVLYLEAEAAGLRGTGIGCFFDDSMHQVLGLRGYGSTGQADTRFQSLYHFTIGGPVEDPRLRTLPSYGSRGQE